ncbi:MAG: nickel transporter [Verrucomicrobiota bacterium]
MLLIAFTGWVAGCTHVLMGPDHLAAVAPLAVRGHRRAWISGFRWGLGHSAGVALVALLLLALRGVLPLEALSAFSERLVGVLLMAIGLWAVRQALRMEVHAHCHSHDDSTHEHLHFHAPGQAHAPAPEPARRAPGHFHGHAAFGIGTLHGLAGSSHLLGVLPALGFAILPDALGYLAGFALGTVMAMAGFASLLGRLGSWFALGHLQGYRILMYASAAAAFLVGGWWVWDGTA